MTGVDTLLREAQAARAAARWSDAKRLYRQAEALAPDAAEIKQNLALIVFAQGELVEAARLAEAAIARAPAMWQARALLARIHQARGDAVGADAALASLLATHPDNATARTQRAGLALNSFGDPQAAADLVAPLAGDAAHGADAELTALMAALYLDSDGAAISARLRDFATRHLHLPRCAPRRSRAGRRRVGLLSPLFTNSPVYHLTFAAFEVLAGAHDVHCFARSTRRDAATEAFQGIAAGWHDAAHLDPVQLAQLLEGEELDILFDLGGWADVAGLKALSAKPAARMYKWVGGQSATTGLDAFDGWIGDAWQSPPELQPLYAEPLIAIAGGYCDFRPPPSILSRRGRVKRGVGLVGNPAKIVPATLAAWPDGVSRVVLIDRRYIHARTRDRVTALLTEAGIAVERVETPPDHAAYLDALAGLEAIVNTQPYAAGLTAVEALALDVKLLAGRTLSPVFAARHHLSHQRTHARNPELAGAIRALVEA